MARPKRNLFALLGWVVWKLLALVGLPLALPSYVAAWTPAVTSHAM